MTGPTLRVAFVAGGLGKGGAEKQLVYMLDALRTAGVALRVYTLEPGGFYEASVRHRGVELLSVRRRGGAAARVVRIAAAVRSWRPHILQAAHFYANLYVGIAARLGGALGIGAIRDHPAASHAAHGWWTGLHLLAPHFLIANSEASRRAAEQRGVAPAALHVVPNVIEAGPPPRLPGAGAAPVAALVANLRPKKRIDRFIEALALARTTTPELRGLILGDGPEGPALRGHAARLGLGPDVLEFGGHCSDVASRLSAADMLVLSSDHEGFPNVVLEAMDAGLPVVTTPAGDSAIAVVDGVTGFVVGYDDTAAMADRMRRLALDAGLRRRLGAAGRARVEEEYGPARLGENLLAAYRSAASKAGKQRVLEAIASLQHPGSSGP